MNTYATLLIACYAVILMFAESTPAHTQRPAYGDRVAIRSLPWSAATRHRITPMMLWTPLDTSLGREPDVFDTVVQRADLAELLRTRARSSCIEEPCGIDVRLSVVFVGDVTTMAIDTLSFGQFGMQLNARCADHLDTSALVAVASLLPLWHRCQISALAPCPTVRRGG